MGARYHRALHIPLGPQLGEVTLNRSRPWKVSSVTYTLPGKVRLPYLGEVGPFRWNSRTGFGVDLPGPWSWS